MNEYEFKSKWICSDMTINDRFSPLFKKNFVISKSIKNVTAYICGLGLFEMKVNGCLPDDSLLNPAHTQYSSTVLYSEFDITHLCKENNIVTVELGNSFFNECGGTWDWQTASWRSIPVLICEITIIYTDGTTETIGTDTSWSVTNDGPTVINGIYQGETFDARRTEETFLWKNALIAKPPKGKLKKQNMPPVRRIKRMTPQNIHRLSDGSYIVTAPEMITGHIALEIDEAEGTQVEIRYGEYLTADGHVVKIGNCEGRDGKWWPDYYIQTDRFISAGKPFRFEPKFSYKGFKYVQISGLTKAPKAENIEIYRVANDVDVYSSFECSNELINSLHSLMRRTMLNNFQWKPTDTPVWEKNGWLGDANCALNSMMYNFNMNTYLESFIDIMSDCFAEYGDVPVIVPSADWETANSPVWNTVFVFGVQALCDFYGRTDYAEKLYEQLKAFAEKDISEIKENGWVWKVRGLADWLAPMNENGEDISPDASEGAEICGTAFIYKMLRSMEKIAVILGKDKDLEVYRTAADKIYIEFNNRFYNKEKGIYETSFWVQKGNRDGSYRQTSNLVPLAVGLVPDDVKDIVVENLVENFRNRDYHLDTGCVGTQFILPVLIDNGYVTEAMKVLTQTSYPSWGYWVKQKTDSAWEGWEDAVRSKNHYFLGTYDEALYSKIAGICDIKDGFKSFTVNPCLDCGLERVKAVINTHVGTVRSEWETDENGNINVTIEVPENCTANVILKKGNFHTEFTAEKGIYIHKVNVT